MDLKTTNLQALPENGILQKFDMLDKNSQLRCGKFFLSKSTLGQSFRFSRFQKFCRFYIVILMYVY